MAEVGDTNFECCSVVYAETDEVELWHAMEATKFRCSVRTAGLPKTLLDKFGTPEFSHDRCESLLGIQDGAEWILR